jgi:hypothetical protein
MTISVGDIRPVIWRCFAGCSQEQTRKALISAGVDPRCLWRNAEDERDFETAVLELFAEDLSHAAFRLRVRALCESFPPGELPSGGPFADLAGRSGVSLAQAYRARPAGSDDVTRTVHIEQSSVKRRRSGAMLDSHGENDLAS